VWVTERPGEGTIVTSSPQLALPIDTQVDGDVVVYRIRLPFLPPSKNQFDGLPIAWKASMKRKWIKAIVEECQRQQIPAAPKIGLSATLVFARAARRDPQNYANCLWNWVPDALQQAGVISDDRDGKIDFGPNLGVRFAVDTRKAPPKKLQVTHLAISMVLPA
jgi:hypothetical protein